MNRRIAYFTIILLGVLSIFSCNRKTINVIAPNSSTVLNGSAFTYSLPRTVVKFKVTAVRTNVYPGPYAAYAKKFLGIESVFSKRSTSWEIENIKIDAGTESDPNSVFIVESEDQKYINLFELVKTGLIVPFSSTVVNSTTMVNVKPSQVSELVWSDLSATPFMAEEKDVLYTKVLRDSTYVRVPVQKSVVVAKSFEEKAQEAADFIFSLRKHRMEFLTTDTDNPIDGLAVKESLQEIAKLESEYLSLFIGKTVSDTVAREFEYIPKGETNETAIVFRFSESKGLLPMSDLSGSPVVLEFKVEDSNNAETAFLNSTANKNFKKISWIYYKIPRTCQVSLLFNNEELAKRRLPIYQFGEMVQIPTKFFEKGK